MSLACMIGHFHLARYLDLCDIKSIVSFVREPIQQVVSHYNHQCRLQGYKLSFDELVELRRNVNLQSRQLAPLPAELIGYLGITEHYRESLELINSGLGLDVTYLQENVNGEDGIVVTELSETQLDKVRKLNKEDISLYQHALRLHEARRKLYFAWVYGLCGLSQQWALHGCAYWQDSDEPVELALYRNGEHRRNFIAKHFYEAYAQAQFPRSRYVGIHLPLGGELHVGDKLEVAVVKTGQLLTLDPVIVQHKISA